jgi:DNA-binding NtrC family response regulator
MATVLIVGSHPDTTLYVAESLRALGWTAVPALGPDAGLRALAELAEVDALVIGGAEALAARTRLVTRLHERHPYAPVVVPTSPDAVGDQLQQAFGGAAH